MVVVAALGGAFGVAARPGGHIHREHQRIGGRQQAVDQQVAEPLNLDATTGQRIVGAAPAALTDRLQAQVRQRRERLGAQQRVASSNSASARREKQACSSVRNAPSRARGEVGIGMAAQPASRDRSQAT
jgi:hypothetical protein